VAKRAQRTRMQQDRERLIAGIAAAGAAMAFVIVFAGLVFHGTIERLEAALPDPPAPDRLETSTVVLDRDGALLRPFTVADGIWRLPVETDAVDPRFLDMLVAYEDRRFHTHDGVDYRALVRAALQFAAAGRIVSGGSTLTMQVARLLLGHSTRTIPAKLGQILLARRIEQRFSKSDILKLYLTLAPYGGNIEGIRAAALAYYGKEPARLTTAEAAMLIAIPQAPERRRPDRFPAAAKKSRDRVLARLVGAGLINREERAAASRERMPGKRRLFPTIAAHASERAVARDRGARVHRLTIRRSLQSSLEKLVRDRMHARGAALSSAVVVADHATGEIVASIGSADYFDESRHGFVDMTSAVRSPGSALKPVIYALAFEAGLAHPETLIEDRPSAFSGYAPVNFDGKFRGTVTIREALTKSLNIPAVTVLNAVGPARLMARLRRAGAKPVLPEGAPAGLAIALGGLGVSLNDLVRVYGAIARGGKPLTLSEQMDAERAANAASPVVNPAAAWHVATILRDTPAPANSAGGRISFKTGTSYGYRDAWAVGFDGRHVAAVWVGRADGVPVPGLTSADTAAPLLMEVFDRIGGEKTPPPAPPAGVLEGRTADLPAPLRRFRSAGQDVASVRDEPEIAFPPDGARVDLGIAGKAAEALAIKIRNGKPPFTWVVNGAPVGRSNFARQTSWQPDGPGFVTISVLDGSGRSDRVTVFVE